MNELYEAFYRCIRLVPSGRVATSGQIAKMTGFPRHSRHVGYALAALPDRNDVPWFRIINALGSISKRDPWEQKEQLQRLEAEGVVFLGGRVNLRVYRWTQQLSPDQHSSAPIAHPTGLMKAVAIPQHLQALLPQDCGQVKQPEWQDDYQ